MPTHAAFPFAGSLTTEEYLENSAVQGNVNNSKSFNN